MKKIIIEKIENKYLVEILEEVVIATAFSFLGYRLDLWGEGKIEIPINSREDEVYFENKKLK